MKLRDAAGITLLSFGLDSCARVHRWVRAYEHPWIVALVMLVIILAVASMVRGRNEPLEVEPLPPDPPKQGDSARG